MTKSLIDLFTACLTGFRAVLNQYTQSVYSSNLKMAAGVSRFAPPVSDSAELELRSAAVPSKTKKSTEWGMRLWQEWAKVRETVAGKASPTTPILLDAGARPSVLDGQVCLEVRKENGSEYPPREFVWNSLLFQALL